MFRLLPIQILLAAVGAVNGIVSSLFASNYVGVNAMSAVGLFAPVTQFLSAVNLMLVGGSQILCGKYMGRNQKERTRNVFSLDLLLAAIVSVVIILLLLIGSVFDLTRFFVADAEVRRLLNHYIQGQAIGILPLMLGSQLAAFLSLENRARRTTIASVAFIIVNLILNYVFVVRMDYGAYGLALASSIGLWVFFLIQAEFFIFGRGLMRFQLKGCRREDGISIFKIGIPGSLSNGYQTIRRLIVNGLVLTFVGSIGMSAFAASDMLLGIVWAVPTGMLAVSRMMMSISIGEEDRKTLCDVMRTMMTRFLPIMFIIAALICAFAVPLTHLYYQDPSAPVYRMTVWGFRLIPFCMPLSMIYMHFVCYGQASGKHVFVHIMSLLDGVVDVAGFSALLVPRIGINGVYIANILNGTVTTIAIIVHAWLNKHRLPRNMEELMVIPEEFGVPENQRMDLSLKSIGEVVTVSEEIQSFCTDQGIDERRALLSGLCMEEMAGNVIEHGFALDNRKHSVDVRVARKEDTIILRIKDDCAQFDPEEIMKMKAPDDPVKNIGIRMVYAIAERVEYQSIMGLNVLTIRI